MDFSNIALYIAPLIGLGTLIIGISAVLRPQAMANKFGIPASGPALPYVVSTGIRDVFIGLTVLVLFYLKEWTALGAVQLCIGIVAASDFRVVRAHGDRKTSYVHLFGMLLVILYGIWLLTSVTGPSLSNGNL